MADRTPRKRASSRSTSAQYYLGPSTESDGLNGHSFDDIIESPVKEQFSVKMFVSRIRRRSRSRRLTFFLALVSLGVLTFYFFHGQPSFALIPPLPSIPHPSSHRPSAQSTSAESSEDTVRKRPPSTDGTHPIWTLITEAQNDFFDVRTRQSRSLPEAVAEYRRRYGIPPPPNFDKWYAFAKQKGVQLIDEYDTIHHSLTPFWGVKPQVIRERAKEALGYDNTLLGVLIRDSTIRRQEGGRGWMQVAIDGMTKEFLKYLPDMDICFNVHDEPRVILQHDDLKRLVNKAVQENMPAANAVEKPLNQFSPRPVDMTEGYKIDEIGRTRFNYLPFQNTWSHSRMSCSPDSPARSLQESWEGVPDDDDAYSFGPLGFIYNQTAFSDICLSPFFATNYGFFDGANSFNIVQDLFPIFSQSKISSYQDILYPSPWYYFGKVPYDPETDIPWKEKEDKVYWRGSTTGGYSRYGGWRRQHRQRFVAKVNDANDPIKILTKTAGEESSANWTVKKVSLTDYKEVFDVKFSEIGQCDKGDCAAQKQHFTVVSKAKPEAAWKSKYLLDMDGNAFSGRFYAFLKSNSMVYKLAIFREWHSETIKPWVHYVPLSLRGEEWLESVRWFLGDEQGKPEGQNMAIRSSDWANKALRNEDMEVWMFRLLLEYGRLIDDNRETIGYVG